MEPRKLLAADFSASADLSSGFPAAAYSVSVDAPLADGDVQSSSAQTAQTDSSSLLDNGAAPIPLGATGTGYGYGSDSTSGDGPSDPLPPDPDGDENDGNTDCGDHGDPNGPSGDGEGSGDDSTSGEGDGTDGTATDGDPDPCPCGEGEGSGDDSTSGEGDGGGGGDPCGNGTDGETTDGETTDGETTGGDPDGGDPDGGDPDGGEEEGEGDDDEGNEDGDPDGGEGEDGDPDGGDPDGGDPDGGEEEGDGDDDEGEGEGGPEGGDDDDGDESDGDDDSGDDDGEGDDSGNGDGEGDAAGGDDDGGDDDGGGDRQPYFSLRATDSVAYEGGTVKFKVQLHDPDDTLPNGGSLTWRTANGRTFPTYSASSGQDYVGSASGISLSEHLDYRFVTLYTLRDRFNGEDVERFHVDFSSSSIPFGSASGDHQEELTFRVLNLFTPPDEPDAPNDDGDGNGDGGIPDPNVYFAQGWHYAWGLAAGSFLTNAEAFEANYLQWHDQTLANCEGLDCDESTTEAWSAYWNGHWSGYGWNSAYSNWNHWGGSTEGQQGENHRQIPVYLSHPSNQTVTATVSPTDITAEIDIDYSLRNRTVTFAPGETVAYVNVDVNFDNDLELTELFKLTITEASNATIRELGDRFYGTIFDVRVDVSIDGQGGKSEDESGAIVWRNSDFSKEIEADEQPEEGLDLFVPDYAAYQEGNEVEASVLDTNFRNDFTEAFVDLTQWWWHSLNDFRVTLDFDDDAIELWVVAYETTAWEGLELAGPQYDPNYGPALYKIRPGVELTPASKRMKFWIEGVNGSTDFATDLIQVEASRVDSGFILTDQAKYTVVETNAGVDGNRDGQISFDNSHDRQLTFWYNSDRETNDGVQDIENPAPNTQADFLNSEISLRRDLEDFASFHVFVDEKIFANTIDTGFNSAAATNGLIKVRHYVEFADSQQRSLLNLFAAQSDRPNAHIDDQFTANIQATDPYFRTAIQSRLDSMQLGLNGGVSPFLFETLGELASNPELVFVSEIEYPNGATTKKEHRVELDLRSFTDFYTRKEIQYKVNGVDLRQNPAFAHFATPVSSLHNSKIRNVPFVGSRRQSAGGDAVDEDVFVIVHGWSMADGRNNIGEARNDWKRGFAETGFKRLYWQGVRGHFVQFDWPTFTNEEGPYQAPIDNYDQRNLTYNASEFQAWRSGNALKETLVQLEGKKHLMAHSMGNVVAAEALRLSSKNSVTPLVENYVAMEAAISSGAYGSNNSGAFDIDYLSNIGPSGHDLYRHWGSGVDDGTSTHLMDGAKVAANKWVNIYNPTDVATNQAWRLNNLTKPFTNSFHLNAATVQSLPPEEIYGYRYVHTVQDGVRNYYRVRYTFSPTNIYGDVLHQTDITNITAGMFAADGSLGASAYEILAFTSQANGITVGNTGFRGEAVQPFDVNIDFVREGWFEIESEDIEPVTFSTHSYQFTHDSSSTWKFWNGVVKETGVETTL